MRTSQTVAKPVIVQHYCAIILLFVNINISFFPDLLAVGVIVGFVVIQK